MHATTMELEEYVSGQLSPGRSSELDVHIERCAECARALVREAKLETALRAIAAELRCGMRADAEPLEEQPEPIAAPGRRSFLALGAMAAALLAFAVTRVPKAPEVTAVPAVLMADAGDVLAPHHGPDVWTAGEVSGGTP
jgi:anti-sigma factor RsiW